MNKLKIAILAAGLSLMGSGVAMAAPAPTPSHCYLNISQAITVAYQMGEMEAPDCLVYSSFVANQNKVIAWGNGVANQFKAPALTPSEKSSFNEQILLSWYQGYQAYWSAHPSQK